MMARRSWTRAQAFRESKRRARALGYGDGVCVNLTRSSERAPWRHAVVFGLTVVFAALGASSASAQFSGDDDRQTRVLDRRTEAAQETPEQEGVRYAVEIRGVESEVLKRTLDASSLLVTQRERPPPSMSRLRRRAEDDIERLDAALRSEGYYEGVITFAVDAAVTPVLVTVNVTPGPQYQLAAVEIEYRGAVEPDAAERPSAGDIGIVIPMAARAPDVVAAEGRLRRLLTERGFPLAQAVERKAVIDKASDTMTVTFIVEAGPRARFGAVSIEGAADVKDDYVVRLLPWKPGDAYDSRKIEAARRALAATNLFSSVVITPAEALDPDGTLPVLVRLDEGLQRSIGFGASFSTDIGVGGEAFWEHRNLLARGEQLRLGITAAEIEQSAKARFRKPHYPRMEHALLADFAINNRDTEAFNEKSVTSFAGLEIDHGEFWRSTRGLSAEFNQIKDEEGERDFFLVGLPIVASRTDVDDALNPTRGSKLELSLTPYYGVGDDEVVFLVAAAGGSAYWALDADSRYVVAGRAKAGMLVGEQTENVPANKRFYAGGGGSIRGYEFQSVGPLDDDGDPLGGRSLIEFGGEVRMRLTDEIGVVPFVDGGTVFDSSYPDFDEELRWAAGLGLRYYTGFGPIRLDIGVPLNKRDVDDDFQFYISFGQAF